MFVHSTLYSSPISAGTVPWRWQCEAGHAMTKMGAFLTQQLLEGITVSSHSVSDSEPLMVILCATLIP